jgi:hypothetical protein
VQPSGKLGETRKIFKVKSAKSARNVEFDYSQNAKAASGGALLGYDVLIPVNSRNSISHLTSISRGDHRSKKFNRGSQPDYCCSIRADFVSFTSKFVPISRLLPRCSRFTPIAHSSR